LMQRSSNAVDIVVAKVRLLFFRTLPGQLTLCQLC
jgi:hypothetical protein